MVRTNNKQNKKKKRSNTQASLRLSQEKQKKEEIISLDEDEEIIKTTTKKRKHSKGKVVKSLLNKKKFKSKSKSKEKQVNKNKRVKKEEPIEIEDESEESDEEEENEEIEEQNTNKKEEKFLDINTDINITKNKKKLNKKENIEKINIDDYKEDPSISIKDHNIIEECCIECNEKNIYRAIKTNDKILYNKCLKETEKISKILKYRLPMLRDMTPLQYMIKSRNKALLTEYLNFANKYLTLKRVNIPEYKLSKLTSGKSDFYKRRYHTRKIGISRGKKLGNNAFIISQPNEDFYYDTIDKDNNIIFHEDDDFNYFKNFFEADDLDDDAIENLLEENIGKGNIDIVEYLMSIFSDRNYYGYNQLHLQVTKQEKNSEKNIEIKNKMSLNKNNQQHITPVHLACINPNENILLKLISNGGEINYQDKLGRKPILFASVCKSPGPLKLLLENNCNINDRDNAGYTPLILACKRGRYENVKILLEQGADPKQKIKGGKYSGIHFACMEDSENNLKIVNLLLNTCPDLIDINGIGRKTPLHFAVIYNCPKIVELLVRNGANIDKKDSYWRTPLLLACKYGYSQIAEYLIKCGAKINKSDNSNNSPLHYACAFGNFQCVKILMEHGADVNHLNMWKNLPIEIALLKNHLGIVNYLINNNIFSINTPFGNGNTFLLYYISDIQEKTLEKIKFIVEKKQASAKISNNNKMNALHFLAYFNYHHFLYEFFSDIETNKLTEKKHKEIYKPKYIALLRQYISFLIKNNCDIDLRNNIGQTPLFFALVKHNFEMAKILIEDYPKEINIKNIDNNGLNIFDYAFNNGNCLLDECFEFIKILFKLYEKVIDKTFLNSYTRYGRNALLNLCENFALHIYDKFYNINKIKALSYIRKKTDTNKKDKNKYFIPGKYIKKIFELSVKELNDFICKKFYPLIEELIKRGCDINCCTQEKKFVNKNKKFENYLYFNNYGKIYPIMYLVSYPESDNLIKLIKKYKININCVDLKNQNLLMYLLKVEKQIKLLDKNNYKKMFNYLLNNCNNLLSNLKNDKKENMFVTEIEKGNYEDALLIYKKFGNNIDINYPYYNNCETLFGKAYLDKDTKLIEFYLTNFKGINLNKMDLKFNKNILHYICMNNTPKNEIDFHKYEKYLNLGVSLSQKDIFGRNPLYYLFLNEYHEIKKNEDPISSLSYLINYANSKNKNELDINSKDICGNSLIFYAAESNAAFCVSYLLSKGAKIKGIKNLENNSVFSYALLGNSTSIQELYNEVNDIKVFEDKLYEINNEPIDDELKKAEERLENINNNKNNNNSVKNKNINEYCAEELFNINYNIKNEKPEIEKDENLETLYQENDEGIELFSNDDKDSNSISNSYSNSNSDNSNDSNDIEENSDEDTFDFKEASESKDEEEKNEMSISEENEEEDMDDDSNNNNSDSNDIDSDNDKEKSENSDKSNMNKLKEVSDIYPFNYNETLDEIISKYINKKLGNNNYHYITNYIPVDKYKIKSKNFPEIKSIKYKINISQKKSDSEAEEKDKSNQNKILSNSLFKYCIEKNQNNIIYYILNKGYDEFHAISDALSSGNYEFALILLERFSSLSINKLKLKNEKGQNLLHILCNNNITNVEKNIKHIEKIFDILIEKIKINKNEFDKEMHTPLYYVIENNNFKFIDYLITKDSEMKLYLQKDNNDKNNLSPLVLLETKILDKTYSDKDISYLLLLLNKIIDEIKTGDMKYIIKYLIRNVVDLDFLPSSSKFEKITEKSPNNLKALNILHTLCVNKSINLNDDIDDKGNNLFLKAAIKNNYNFFDLMMIFVDLLDIKIDFNKVNKEGKSLIHCLICPHSLYSYQNETFLKEALKKGFNPNIKDKEGLTPLDYAKKYGYKNMINILLKYKAIETKQKKENFMLIEDGDINTFKSIKNINFDYNKISDKYYKEKIEPFISIKKPVQNLAKTLVTQNCELIVDNYRVYKDKDNCLYNVNLSKVDIKKNLYSKYVFYHMQLLFNEKRNMYNLITRWGEFGESGQYQNTPFTDIEEAIKEFNKIFYTKTKNNWERIKNNFDLFEKRINKYELLHLTEKRPEINNIIDYFNEELKNINIKITQDSNEVLNPNTKELFLNLIQATFSEKIGKYDSNDDYNNKNIKYNVLYFSKESLNKGIKILNELALLNDKLSDLKEKINNKKINEKNLENENSQYNINKKEYREVSQKILILSNTYYELIPNEDKNNYSIEPINSGYKVTEEMKKLLSYTYIEDTLKLFLSSLYYCNKLDPINYIYTSINKKIVPLNLDLSDKSNKDKAIVKILLNYIRLYKESRRIITNIFEIKDKNRNELGNDINKRILLFHGTKAENVIGILNKGLLIAPIEAETSGNKYGNGIYLSDSFFKALNYSSGNGKIYVLVVDTFLDKAFKISKKNKFNDVKTLKKKKFNCLINDTRIHITDERIYLVNGSSVPTNIIEEEYDDDYDYDSEYVIYDPKLVNVKYIIELQD